MNRYTKVNDDTPPQDLPENPVEEVPVEMSENERLMAMMMDPSERVEIERANEFFGSPRRRLGPVGSTGVQAYYGYTGLRGYAGTVGITGTVGVGTTSAWPQSAVEPQWGTGLSDPSDINAGDREVNTETTEKKIVQKMNRYRMISN